MNNLFSKVKSNKTGIALVIILLFLILQTILLLVCIRTLKHQNHLLFANILADDYIVESSSGTYHRVKIDKE